MKDNVEILLSTYNGERFLHNQLKSIQNQSYQNWHILCRDDGSSDGTLKILEEFKIANPNKITIIRDSLGNLGTVKSFSKLLVASSTTIVMLCDQDDEWNHLKIEQMMNFYNNLSVKERNNPVLLHSDLELIDEKGLIIHKSLREYQKLNTKYREINYLLVQNNVTGCSTLLNRSLVDKVGTIPQGIIMHDWWIALVASAFGNLYFLPKTLTSYRQHSNNQIGSVSELQLVKRSILSLESKKVKVLNSIHQGEIFFNKYKNYLSYTNKLILKQFVLINTHNPIKRLKVIYSNKFFHQTVARNFGYIITILSLPNYEEKNEIKHSNRQL